MHVLVAATDETGKAMTNEIASVSEANKAAAEEGTRATSAEEGTRATAAEEGIHVTISVAATNETGTAMTNKIAAVAGGNAAADGYDKQDCGGSGDKRGSG